MQSRHLSAYDPDLEKCLLTNSRSGLMFIRRLAGADTTRTRVLRSKMSTTTTLKTLFERIGLQPLAGYFRYF